LSNQGLFCFIELAINVAINSLRGRTVTDL
jgi:hypothetical protein